MRRPLFLLFCTFFSFSLSYSQTTEYIYLSGKYVSKPVVWDFFCTDGRQSGFWSKINVPAHWELEGFGSYNYGHDWSNPDRNLGKEHGIYKHSFMASTAWRDKHIQIVFEGVMTDTKVKVNGLEAGPIHQGGFYRFSYDITDKIKFDQENILEIDVAKHSTNTSVNEAERQADFWIFGGIYRPVYLKISPSVHMDRIALNPMADGSLTGRITLNQHLIDGFIRISLFDLNGNQIGASFSSEAKTGKEFKISTKWESIKAWNPEFPNLYNAQIELHSGDQIVHRLTQRIGFRTIELRKHDAFYVNNQRVRFKGVNRHSFWPETGRALSRKNHLDDIRLMKDMNMNAVRMSHYPPDAEFLDLCDSLGLFVLDEVSGWQQGYDTVVGPQLIKETILKDENHPSVIIWDHGNEGGWNLANEKWFHHYDIQKRPVVYPWLHRNGVDCFHYPTYEFGINRFTYGKDVFMPLEFLHGLYDGGHGAGLGAFWRNYSTNPRFAGSFLWVLRDEAVLRTDLPGNPFDSDGNHAPDGIVGPHNEKEGSYYTIKEIWCPVQIEPVVIHPDFNGKLFLKNDFLFTNLNQCSFAWKALQFEDPLNNILVQLGGGTTPGPDAQPGEIRAIELDLPSNFEAADIFSFTAFNPEGKILYTWSWPIHQPGQYKEKWFNEKTDISNPVRWMENETTISVSAAEMTIRFDKISGEIINLENKKGQIPFSGGKPTGIKSAVKEINWQTTSNGDFRLNINYEIYPKSLTWSIYKDGAIRLEASPLQTRKSGLEFVGISFKYPEHLCKGIRWIGNGPYRVWKNRLEGNQFGLWEKAYNNTVTGESFDNLVYPEFKGYHDDLYWLELQSADSDFQIFSETPNLYFQLYTPKEAQHNKGGVNPPFPNGDLSFLYEIPAIGTKFKEASQLGSGSQPGEIRYHQDNDSDPIILWFDFRSK